MDVADGNQKRSGKDPNGQALVTEAKAVLEDLNCTQQCLLKKYGAQFRNKFLKPDPTNRHQAEQIPKHSAQ